MALISAAEFLDTSSAGGRLVVNVLGAVAQWEREATAERTSAAVQVLKAQGRATGGVAPYGFQFIDGRRAWHQGEQETLAAIIEHRHAGLSWAKVADSVPPAGPMQQRRPAPPPVPPVALDVDAPRSLDVDFNLSIHQGHERRQAQPPPDRPGRHASHGRAAASCVAPSASATAASACPLCDMRARDGGAAEVIFCAPFRSRPAQQNGRGNLKFGRVAQRFDNTRRHRAGSRHDP